MIGQYNSLGEYCDPHTASTMFFLYYYPPLHMGMGVLLNESCLHSLERPENRLYLHLGSCLLADLHQRVKVLQVGPLDDLHGLTAVSPQCYPRPEGYYGNLLVWRLDVYPLKLSMKETCWILKLFNLVFIRANELSFNCAWSNEPLS